MADPLPTQPATPSAPPPPAAQAPGIVQAFVGVLTKPASFYASVRDAGGFGSPVVFALVLGIVAGVISAAYAVLGIGAAGAGPMGGAMVGFSAIIATPIVAVIGCFVGGAIVHVVSLIAGGKGTYEQSVRVAGYAAATMPISALLSFVPFLQFVVFLYGLYLAAQGIIAIHAANRTKTYVVTGVLAVLVVVLGIMATVAGHAMQQVGSEMQHQQDLQRVRQGQR
ncbi:MAG TPA: YIP1 family protein [Anaeromyxobacter sp.]